MKKWSINNNSTVKKESDVLKILLKNRGLDSKKSIDEFFNLRLTEMTLKSVNISMDDFLKFEKRVSQAISKKEKVIIFGDYDVDGICATAILWEALYAKNDKVLPYIPERVEEGYGLSIKGIDNLLKKHPETKLIITVDNGIVAHDAVKYAKSKNIGVIITDHHVKDEKTPKAYCILHTTILCGAAIAWLIVKESKIASNEEIEDFLGLAALATVADLVPLRGPNRIIVKHGLEALRKSCRIGYVNLLKKSGIEKNDIDVYKIGHVIAPRLNASGRIQNAMNALRLLCTSNENKAGELSELLENLNRSRQEITQKSVEHARLSVISEIDKSKVIIVANDSYNQGIIGLIASRLVEVFYKPALAISIGENVSKGSARSIEGVNIIELIRSVGDTVLEAGGHPMAAGFSLKTEAIQEFKEAISDKANEVVFDELLSKVVKIECLIDFSVINKKFLEIIGKFEPFGMDNPEPVFATNGVTVVEARRIGKDLSHLKLKVENNGVILDGVAFGFGEKIDLKEKDDLDIAYTIDENLWNGKSSIQLKIKDIKEN